MGIEKFTRRFREGTPKLSRQIKDLLRNNGYSNPTVVTFENVPDCKPMQCWLNVPMIVECLGGEAVPGRCVWQQVRGRWLHLEAHCVWRKPDGTLSDPTPKTQGETQVVFVEEPLVYRGFGIASVYLAMKKQDAEICRLLRRQAEINAGYSPGTEHAPTYEQVEILKDLMKLI